MINPFLVYEELQSAKLCKKRNVKGFYIGPSAANAKGWIAPRPDLDKYSSSLNGKLNKRVTETMYQVHCTIV